MSEQVNYSKNTQQAIFAAGCFWGLQFYFDQVPGVTKTIVGYTGGHTKNPTYEDVSSQTTGHAEAILIDYDPKVVTYETLVKHFFRLHDPTTLNRQGPDIGENYRSAVFYLNDDQKSIAEEVKTLTQREYKEPIVTQIQPAEAFYRAEEYHQKFTERNGIGMCHIPYKKI